MLLANKNVAIVGGGPGGLTLARLLQLKGVRVRVYERDINQKVRTQGGTLDLHEESGLAALTKAGLMEAFKANYRPGADRIRIIDSQARIHFDEHTGKPEADLENSFFRPEIDRGPLRRILLESLQSDTVFWNYQFASMTALGNSWKLIFKNGATPIADIVNGADGANSQIRPFITDIKPFYSGNTVVEGNVHDSKNNSPRIHELLKGGKIFALGGEQTLIVSSKGDGDLSFYAGIKKDERWVSTSGIDFTNRSQVLNWFKDEFADWSSVWQELFQHEQTYFIPRPQYCVPLDQTWSALPNLTMLGDAAHVMPPYAGEGVNMAMQDALQLSECITDDKYGNILSAIAFYESEMRKRSAKAAKKTILSMESLHSTEALEKMIGMFNQ